MGEQSKENEPDEASSFDPFVRSEVEYDAATRLRMAEEMAHNRRLFVSPALKEIIVNPENFYHECQQSAKMAEDANQRRQMSFNTKREAYIQQIRAKGLPLPSKIPMIEINPTRVTLSLEFESQYYSLMTNDYGDHENVASIMQATNTLIQLPDHTTEGSPPDPFVQQVTITGHYGDVDKARKLMRENCHVSVYMSLNDMNISLAELQAVVGQDPIKNVEMSFINSAPEKNEKVSTYLRLTTRSKNQHDLIKASNKILQKAFGNEPQRKHNIFCVHFTLSTFHIDHVIGSSATTLLMPLIEQRTNVRINHPKYNTKDDIRGSLFVVKITGGIENVLEARKCLMDLLPVSMCFNMKNTDMAAPSGLADRCVHVVIEESRTMFKMTPSVYEPSELLSEEVPLHCASLRSKEFNIKHMYTAYQKVLTRKMDVVAPQPTDYDRSMWHRSLPGSFFSFSVPCRGETSDSTISHRRYRSLSTTSTRSRQTAKGKAGSDGSNPPTRMHTRVPSVSECIAQPFLAMPPFPDPQTQLAHFIMMQQQHALLKGSPVLQPTPIPLLMFDPTTGPRVFSYGAPEFVQFDPFNHFQFPFPHVAEVDQAMNRPESTNSVQQPQSNRKPTKMMNRPASAASMHNPASSTQRPRRVYEQLRDDDARSSTRSGSRRTSVSGDEPIVGSFEDRGSGGFDRQYSRNQQRYTKNEDVRWKTGSRGDVYGKRTTNFNREFRGPTPQEPESHVGSAGSSDAPSEQIPFQSTHHLNLKPNEVDLEHERLFTHDSPHVEDPSCTKNGFGNELMDGDFVQRLLSNVNLNDQHKRSRAISCLVDRDDQTARQTESDCAYSLDHASSYPSRSIDSFKKMAGIGVTKTMLEPRFRVDKEYGKINLDHKSKFSIEQNEEEKYAEMSPSLGSRQYRMDPMTLIASVRESSEQLPRIHERQFSDVLHEKEKKLAASAFNERNMETNIVQEPSLDETSPMDYAFRSEQSTENIQ